MSELSTLNLWLSEHAGLILPAVGIIAFIESFAIAGIVVPGVALLFSIAALASISDIALIDVLIAAFVGAVAGDVSSFFIGRAFHDRLQTLWPFSRYPDSMKQGEAFFQKYGMLSVVIGRFIGPLRPVLPITAGMLHMPPTQFVTVNVISALAWALVYILPGYLGAELSQSFFSSGSAQNALWLLIAIVAAITPWLLLFGWAPNKANSIKRYATLATYSLLAFITLTWLTLTGALDRMDVWFFALAVEVRNAYSDILLIAITLMGDEALLIALFLSSSVYLWFNQKRRLAFTLASAGIVASLLTHMLKLVLDVTRPDFILGAPATAAYPSGHTSGAAIYIGTLLLLSQFDSSIKNKTAMTTALILISAITASRLMLGVHWVSDIVAGLLLGSFIVAVAGTLLHIQKDSNRAAENTFSWSTLLAISVTIMTMYVLMFFDRAFQYYQIA